MVVKTESGSVYYIPKPTSQDYQSSSVRKAGQETQVFQAKLLGSAISNLAGPSTITPGVVFKGLALAYQRQADAKVVFTSPIMDIIL